MGAPVKRVFTAMPFMRRGSARRVMTQNSFKPGDEGRLRSLDLHGDVVAGQRVDIEIGPWMIRQDRHR